MARVRSNDANSHEIALEKLSDDRALTARVKGVDPKIVAVYAEQIAAGATLPPIEVFRDEAGELWVGDGLHRLAAARANGAAAILARVQEGGRQAALRCAVAANEAHGLRRTPADKRKAVAMLLGDPEFNQQSSAELAKLALVSHTFVDAMRKSIGNVAGSSQRVGKDGKKRKLPAAAKRRSRFNGAKVAKSVPKVLDRIAKEWPKSEPIAPLVEAVLGWLASIEANTASAEKAAS
jgi:uncharacterized ParB-like nuclease family protein